MTRALLEEERAVDPKPLLLAIQAHMQGGASFWHALCEADSEVTLPDHVGAQWLAAKALGFDSIWQASDWADTAPRSEQIARLASAIEKEG